MKDEIKELIKSKGFYITLGAGICAVLVIAYTMTGIKNAQFRISKLNETKNELVKNTEKNEENNVKKNEERQKVAKNDASKDKKNADNSTQKKNTNDNDDSHNNSKSNYSRQDGVESGVKNNNKKSLDSEDKNVSSSNYKSTNTNVKNDIDKSDETKTAKNEKYVAAMAADNKAKEISFDKDKGLSWPVNGEIIKDYSKDRLVYFKTLGQYKCNQALFIQAQEGTEVKSASKGIVKDVSKDDELGNYIIVDIGDSYTLIYAQLDNISVKKGDKVDRGVVIGKVAKPSSYYVLEGSHVYFKVKKDNESIDPKTLLKNGQ